MADRPRSWGAGFAERRSQRLPPELSSPIATTGDGRDITQPWVRDLQEARDPRLWASVDWGVYERIRQDAQVKSCMEQRIRAVVSREWDVLPGDEDDTRAIAAGDALKAAVERTGWDRVTERMLWASFYGYQVAELGWGAADGLLAWVPSRTMRPIHVRHARRFRLDQDGALRLLTNRQPRGEVLPERKFWMVTAGGTDDDVPYGQGLAEWLYWPTLFKRNGIRFWNIFLDKFSVPTAKGTYPRGSSKADVDKLLGAIAAIANDSGFAIPEGMQVELLTMAQSGADFGAVCRYMDGEIAKIILSQTMTTDNGSSRSQGEVHADVKMEIVKADADLLSDSFNSGPARWFTDLNFGTNVAAPRLVRIVEEEDDLKAAAETDEALSRLGWRRTDDSHRDRYGDGYERADPPVTPPAADADRLARLTDRRDLDGIESRDEDGKVVPIRASAFAETVARPLYVHRPLLNAGDLIGWARAQGLSSTLAAADLHVTIAYSRTPIDWTAVRVQTDHLVVRGGARAVGRLGTATVLHFASAELVTRHRAIRAAGASWDFADYHPHVTLTYADTDLAALTAYDGPLIFGPEVLGSIDDDWDDAIVEVPLAQADAVDEAVTVAMVDEGWTDAADAMVAPLVARLQAASSAEDVAAILADAGGDRAPDALAEQLARAGFALRIDALTGGEG